MYKMGYSAVSKKVGQGSHGGLEPGLGWMTEISLHSYLLIEMAAKGKLCHSANSEKSLPRTFAYVPPSTACSSLVFNQSIHIHPLALNRASFPLRCPLIFWLGQIPLYAFTSK